MGDVGEDYKALNEMKKGRHQKWFDDNMKLIIGSAIPHEFKGTVCLFRQSSLSVDFYPHTGRWKYRNKMFRGGAKAFLKWYEKALRGE